MPKEQKDLKRLTRERMARTGERYVTARSNVRGDGPGGAITVSATVGRALREARRQRGWDLTAAASALSVPRLKVWLLEQGGASVDASLVERIGATYAPSARTMRALGSVARRAQAAAHRDHPDLTRFAGRMPGGMWVTPVCNPRGRSWLTAFAVEGSSVFALVDLGEQSVWVQSLRDDDRVQLDSSEGIRRFGRAHVLTEGTTERSTALRALDRRYPGDLDWMATVMVVQVDLDEPAADDSASQ